MKILHLMAGLEGTSGVANIARRFARVQSERGDAAKLLAPARKCNPIFFEFAFAFKALKSALAADEIWVHCSWTFPVWYGAALAALLDKRLVVVPEASFDPKRLNNHARWKKRLVMPLDRWVVRRADAVLALGADEIEWVRAFEPSARVRLERVPTFYAAGAVRSVPGEPRRGGGHPLRTLFLGRAEDPLKGVRYLEQAVRELNAAKRGGESVLVELRVVSKAYGEELERVWEWCEVLCLPTLSDNFGLVVAEALEHGRPVITTDGASAWADESEADSSPIVYLRGYRQGTDAERVEMLKGALERFIGG